MGASYSTIEIGFPRTDKVEYIAELRSNESKEERVKKLLAALAEFKQNAKMSDGYYRLDIKMPSGFFGQSDEVLAALKTHDQGIVASAMNIVYVKPIKVYVWLNVSDMYMVDSANDVKGALTPVFSALGFAPVFSFSN